MIEVRVPDEQEGTKAVVRAWLKQVGDTPGARMLSGTSGEAAKLAATRQLA